MSVYRELVRKGKEGKLTITNDKLDGKWYEATKEGSPCFAFSKNPRKAMDDFYKIEKKYDQEMREKYDVLELPLLKGLRLEPCIWDDSKTIWLRDDEGCLGQGGTIDECLDDYFHDFAEIGNDDFTFEIETDPLSFSVGIITSELLFDILYGFDLMADDDDE